MGNSESIETKTAQEVFQNYQLMGVEENPKFGDVSLYKDKTTGEVVWVKEIPLEEKESETTIDGYLSSNLWKDSIFITKQVYKIVPKEGFFCSNNCNTSRRIVVIMHYLERDLESEITQRASEFEKDYFPEPEIWYIVESIMGAEAAVLRQNRFHGDLRTSSIFISEDGQTKFSDPTLIDHKSNAYFKVMTGEARCNLPPEYIQALHAGQREPKSNPELADIFAIGIVILGLATLHEDSWYYDWAKKEIVWRNIQESLAELKMRYSPLLSRLAEGCLKERMAERIHIGDILHYVEERKNSAN